MDDSKAAITRVAGFRAVGVTSGLKKIGPARFGADFERCAVQRSGHFHDQPCESCAVTVRYAIAGNQ